MQSARDYQAISPLGQPLSIQPLTKRGSTTATFHFDGTGKAGSPVACGAYLYAPDDCVLGVRIVDSNGQLCVETDISLESQRYWTRVGLLWTQSQQSASWQVDATWPSTAALVVWGLSLAPLTPPVHVRQFVDATGDGIEYLAQRHLAPEAFYLQHDAAICNGRLKACPQFTAKHSSRENPGKKCSQCQRSLPVDPRLSRQRAATRQPTRSPQAMVLAFHGHKAKRTGYQNECRACKKFEINEFFNRRRTADQLNESSVLTRERKILLRENKVLEEFKQRVSKKGLRHFVWQRFGRRCFKCKQVVTLKGFELDHTRPLAYLWPLDEFATCLCATCNNNKKDSFPVDFYSNEELRELARLVGLALKDLRAKTVNQPELDRIRSDIAGFARSWEPRLFASIATRVRELSPAIDLFGELEQASPTVFQEITAALACRAESV